MILLSQQMKWLEYQISRKQEEWHSEREKNQGWNSRLFKIDEAYQKEIKMMRAIFTSLASCQRSEIQLNLLTAKGV
jgi:hypothetical protein